MDPKLAIFLYGVLGSAAVEILRLLRGFEKGRPLAKRYKSVGFWALRGSLALVGGFLAVAYDIQNGVLAFHIGATAPLIIDAMTKTRPD
jgi:hypothetical protein